MGIPTPEEFTPQTQESTLSPLITMTVDKKGRIKEALHIEKLEAVCDLCRWLIVPRRKELGERTSGYAVIVDGRMVQVICEECRKRLWGWV